MYYGQSASSACLKKIILVKLIMLPKMDKYDLSDSDFLISVAFFLYVPSAYEFKEIQF